MNEIAVIFDNLYQFIMDKTSKEEPQEHEVKNVVFVIISLIAAVAVALWLTL